MDCRPLHAMGIHLQPAGYFTHWHTSMSTAKMSPNTCQIFIKLITVSQQTQGRTNPGLGPVIYGIHPLTVWHDGEGDHPAISQITRRLIFLFYFIYRMQSPRSYPGPCDKNIYINVLYLHNAWSKRSGYSCRTSFILADGISCTLHI